MKAVYVREDILKKKNLSIYLCIYKQNIRELARDYVHEWKSIRNAFVFPGFPI